MDTSINPSMVSQKVSLMRSFERNRQKTQSILMVLDYDRCSPQMQMKQVQHEKCFKN